MLRPHGNERSRRERGRYELWQKLQTRSYRKLVPTNQVPRSSEVSVEGVVVKFRWGNGVTGLIKYEPSKMSNAATAEDVSHWLGKR